ncbi:MAG: Ig-like domain-containing protein, partial [Chloroflexi bacterium]|nr:Ig-like domain-containing protein [Chloroflexota bacterium]MBU1748662.1 Ig-like domain-containing protein [Chloroflexota bacterium]
TADDTPTLTWNISPSPDVAGYQVDFAGTVTDVGNVTTHNPGLLADGTYTWTVAAYDAVGNVGVYAAVWSFTVDTTAPAPPTLVSPANGSTTGDNTPTLTWNISPSPDAAGYQVDFAGTVTDVGDVTAHNPGLLADGTYTWTVATYDALGHIGAYTDTWSFTVDTVSPVIVAVSPANGATEVGIATPVVITFSRPMNAATLAYSVMPDPGGWSVTWDGGGTIAMLTHDPLGYWRAYTVTITAAGDALGNPLVGVPYVWRFTTAPHRLYLPLALRDHVSLLPWPTKR